jgi:5-aminolevulinate synthase
LEREVASLHNKQRGMVSSTCYVVNEALLSTLPNILGKDTVYFSDASNHASMINGMKHSRAERKVWRHNDTAHLEELLKATDISRPKIIVFESVYSMSGTVSPIEKVIQLAKKYNALTVLDEVHAVALYGPTGAGIAEQLGLQDDIDMITGTMGKGYGVFGGYVVGNEATIDAVRSNAAGFIFTTSLPPCVCAAAMASIQHLRTSQVERDAHKRQTRNLLSRLL